MHPMNNTAPASVLEKMDTSTYSQDQATTTSTNGQNNSRQQWATLWAKHSALIAMQKSLSLPNSSWTDVSRQPPKCEYPIHCDITHCPIDLTWVHAIEFSPKCAKHYNRYLSALHPILSTTFLIAFMCVVVSWIPIYFYGQHMWNVSEMHFMQVLLSRYIVCNV